MTISLTKTLPQWHLHKIWKLAKGGKFRGRQISHAQGFFGTHLGCNIILKNWFCKCQWFCFLFILWLSHKFWVVETGEIFSDNELPEKVQHWRMYKTLSHRPTQLKGYQPDKKEFSELNLTWAHHQWMKGSSQKTFRWRYKPKTYFLQHAKMQKSNKE